MTAGRAAALVVIDGIHAALRSTLTAAYKLSPSADVLVVGPQASSAASQIARLQGVNSVLIGGEDVPVTAEGVAPIIQKQIEEGGYTNVLSASGSFGKNVMPRVAGRMMVGCVSDVVQVDGDEFVRPIYAGNALARVRSLDKVRVMTVRPTMFEQVGEGEGLAEIVKLGGEGEGGSEWKGEQRMDSGRPELTSAKCVVAGGRGLGSGQNFEMLEELADLLGGAVGATRAAVDAGMVPNDWQVGQTGKVVAPELYVAVGLSGAIQHVAGMRESRVIVAVNKDREAPIFDVADYGVVGDLFQVVPELSRKIRERKEG